MICLLLGLGGFLLLVVLFMLVGWVPFRLLNRYWPAPEAGDLFEATFLGLMLLAVGPVALYGIYQFGCLLLRGLR